MAGSSSKDFECITSGYPLRDYQVCITKEIFSYSAKSKSYKVFYIQGVRCVCVWGGGGRGGKGGLSSCETVEMTRDCCEKGPFKLVIRLLFSMTHGKKQGVYVGKLDA